MRFVQIVRQFDEIDVKVKEGQKSFLKNLEKLLKNPLTNVERCGIIYT